MAKFSCGTPASQTTTVGVRLLLVTLICVAHAFPKLQRSAAAIDFTINYSGGGEHALDPDGSRLRFLADAAGVLWSQYLPDDRNFEFDLSWDNLDDNALGVYEPGFAIVTANIKLDTTDAAGDPRKWFFDPTPLDHSEFNLQQELYRQMPVSEQDEAFNGSPPDLLEVGYGGTAALGSGVSGDEHDLLTVILHEIGHFIGINYNLFGDGDYDFDSNTVGGAAVAAVEAPDPDPRHLLVDTALMFPTLDTAKRVLPSATDILALEEESDFSQYDVPRVDFLGGAGTSWTNTLNWIGGRIPDAGNDVFVRHGGTATMPTGGSVVTDDLRIAEGSTVMMNNTNLTVRKALEVSQNSMLIAAGNISAVGALVNNGTLAARLGATVNLQTASATPVWDLDGATGTGLVDLMVGNLVVNGDHSDPFNGLMRIGGGHTATFNGAFELGAGGEIELRGRLLDGNPTNATIAGNDTIKLGGRLDVDGRGLIRSSIETLPFANVVVANTDDLLILDGPVVRFNGGTFGGNGTVGLNTFAVVGAPTIIATELFDWDGAVGNSQTNIGSNGELIINSSLIENSGDGHDGTVHILGGRLVVNTPAPWRMEGQMVLTGGGRIEGQQMILDGELQTDFLFPFFPPNVDAPIMVRSGGTIRAENEALTLSGELTLDGGLITATRKITQVGDIVVRAPSQIDSSSVYLWGTDASHSTIINDDAQLSIHARSFSTIPFVSGAYQGTVDVGANGRLHVAIDDFDAWAMNGTMLMAPGSVITGDDLNNNGRIEGSGTIQSTLINRGVVAPDNLQAFRYEQTGDGTLELLLTDGGHSSLSMPLGGTLDGTVSVELADAFLPALGTEFFILSSTTLGQISGVFDNVELLAPFGVRFDGFLNYASQAVTFEVSVAELIADFDGDQDVDADDIDQLTSAIRESLPDNRFDLNGDGQLNQQDLTAMVEDYIGTLFADANLDLIVDGQDFVLWNTSKFTPGTGWASGDFNGDGISDGHDFVLWNAHKFTGADATIAVPEPATSVFCVAMFLAGVAMVRVRIVAPGRRYA